MIIGIDASRANREQKTGVEWYSYYLIENLKKIPFQKGIKFLLYSDRSLKNKLKYLPLGWQVKILSWPPKYFWTQIRFSLEMFFQPVDLLFIPAHALPIIHPKKTVITLHDLAFEKFPELYSFWQRKYLRFVYKFALKRATKIIVPSLATKNDLIEIYQADSEKIKVIHLAYDKKIFKPIKNQEKIERILKKYKIKKPYLLYVGRLEKKKGIEILLKAYQKLEKINQELGLVLIGKPGYGYNQEIKNQKLKIKNITELGYVQQNDLPYLYNGAEIFVFPTFYEGFGVPVLEAMACARPVITSDIESLKEIGGEAVTFFKCGHSEDLAKKIKEVLENSKIREQLIINGLEWVKNFSWQKCAEETLKVLENL